MTTENTFRQWRLRLVWLRGILVVMVAFALLTLSRWSAHAPSLFQLLALATLLVPNLLTLATQSKRGRHHQAWLGVELGLDVILFTVVLHGLGGAGNPLAFYLLVPVLLAGLTQKRLMAIAVMTLALLAYFISLSWHHMPDSDTMMHSLSHDHSGLHGIGMALVFAALAVSLNILGLVIQSLNNARERQQQQALNLAGQREKMYQVAATLADQAHELNTPLSTLVMLADNVAQDADCPASIREDLAQIDAIARRVALRLKTSVNENLPSTLTLDELVNLLRQHMRHLAPTMAISREGTFNPSLKNPEGWLRVLMNLAYNAMDAGATQLVINSADNDLWHVIQLSDNGPHHGNSERQGMGIGLALVHATVEQLGAEFDLEFTTRWTQARIRWGSYADER